MITVDAPISFVVGGAIALACKEREAPRIRDRNRLLYRGMLFQSTILTPVILYFMLRFPDWEWNYMFDAGTFFFGGGQPTLAFAILCVGVALINLSFFLGFLLVEALVARGRERAALGALGGVGAAIGLTIAVMYRQTLHLGTYDAFQAGEADLIFTNLEFLAVETIAGLLVVPTVAWIIWSNRRQAAA